MIRDVYETWSFTLREKNELGVRVKDAEDGGWA
jgi:hypothetical protein